MVVGLRSILGTDTHWRMPLLYVPFILPFVVVSLACIPLLRMTREATAAAWSESLGRIVRPAAAMAGALVLAKMMTVGGDRSAAAQIGLAAADFAGPAWPMLAPLLGALGSFFSGSNTVSNLTFAPIQDAIAATIGLDRISMLALQSAGGAMGNMACVHNIVAVGAVLGLADRGGDDHRPAHVASILRLVAAPLTTYAIVAATMATLLTL
jgi:lactate permease